MNGENVVRRSGLVWIKQQRWSPDSFVVNYRGWEVNKDPVCMLKDGA